MVPSPRRVIDQPRADLDGRVEGGDPGGDDVEPTGGPPERRPRALAAGGRRRWRGVFQPAAWRAGPTRPRRSTRIASRSSARSTAACVWRAMRWAVVDRSLVDVASVPPAPSHDRVPSRFGRGPIRGDAVDELTGTCGRCLQRGVRHLVGHAAVDLVTQPGEHRHRAGGDGAGDDLGVEHGEFVLRAAATDDHDGVEVPEPGERARSRRRRWPTRTRPAPARRRRTTGIRGRSIRVRARKSCQAAVPTLVTAPIRSGTGDKGRRRFASSSPSATRRRTISSRDWAMSPSVYFGSMPVIFRPMRPVGA